MEPRLKNTHTNKHRSFKRGDRAEFSDGNVKREGEGELTGKKEEEKNGGLDSRPSQMLVVSCLDGTKQLSQVACVLEDLKC